MPQGGKGGTMSYNQDTFSSVEIICPHCGYTIHPEATEGDYEAGERRDVCLNIACGKPFIINCEHSVTWETRVIDESEAAK